MDGPLTVSIVSHQSKWQELKNRIRDLKSVAVCLSGGADSAVLLSVALEALGHRKVAAVTFVSPLMSRAERESVIRTVRDTRVVWYPVDCNHLEDEDFVRNDLLRCYYCKKRRFAFLQHIPDVKGFTVIDGTNLDDLSEFRPGLNAIHEFGVITPYLDVGVGKAMIRTWAQELGLENCDRPPEACLATRIQVGCPITRGVLSRAEAAEEVLKGFGIGTVRVRLENQGARIEVDGGWATVVDRREEILRRFNDLGIKQVTLDLEGYRRGKQNGTADRRSQ